jgi:hypothetical protein
LLVQGEDIAGDETKSRPSTAAKIPERNIETLPRHSCSSRMKAWREGARVGDDPDQFDYDAVCQAGRVDGALGDPRGGEAAGAARGRM